jgi:uncharacterized protein YbaR (Trm112 family)
MYIELVDHLCCPASHERSHLVAAPDVMQDRHIVSGILGCPLCAAEYQVIEGVAVLRSAATNERPSARTVTSYDALRCAALLNLAGDGGYAVLVGVWGSVATLLLDSPTPHLVLIDPPADVVARSGLSIILADAHLPLAGRFARGMAIDERGIDRFPLEGAAELVMSGGRLVAPAAAQPPAAATILASDTQHWVAGIDHPVLTTLTRPR